MTTLLTTTLGIRDPEAAVYAIEAAVGLCESIASGNIIGACIDAITLAGFTKNTLGL